MITPTFDDRREYYAHAWRELQLDPSKAGDFRAAAARIIGGRARYENVSGATGVPWVLIGLLHERESGCDFGTHLHNGDPLEHRDPHTGQMVPCRTRHVPAGRPQSPGPWTFEESAQDALELEGFERFTWDCVERIAYALEQFNGWGYYYHHCPPAYLWSHTNQYHGGKFIADHVFDANVYDPQLGAMGILKVIADEVPECCEFVEPRKTASRFSPKAKPEELTHIDADGQLREASLKYRCQSWLVKTFGFGGGTAVGVSKLHEAGITDPLGAIGTVAGFLKNYGVGISLAASLGVCGAGLFLMYRQRLDLIAGNYRPSGDAQ